MTQADRIARLGERLAQSKFAANSEHILDVVRGKEPLRAGMPVEVERATGSRKAPNGETYHVKIKASTEAIARDQGIIPISAWEKGGLRNFTENPIILAYHDHKQPIGRSVYTELNGNALIEYWEFHLESEVSRMMQKLYEKGFMRAASVGFLVEEFTFVDELDDKQLEKLVEQYGAAAVRDIYWIATRAELLETSAVPVPSDPNALTFDFAARNAEAVGIDVSALRSIVKPGDTMTEEEKARAAEAAAAATNGSPAADTTTNGAIAEIRQVFEDGFKGLREELASLRTLVEKGAAAPAAEVTPAASTSASTESATTTERSPEDSLEISIEKLDGESDEAAMARHVDEMVARLRGAPIPSKK